jgi:hypothetical protein
MKWRWTLLVGRRRSSNFYEVSLQGEKAPKRKGCSELNFFSDDAELRKEANRSKDGVGISWTPFASCFFAHRLPSRLPVDLQLHVCRDNVHSFSHPVPLHRNFCKQIPSLHQRALRGQNEWMRATLISPRLVTAFIKSAAKGGCCTHTDWRGPGTTQRPQKVSAPSPHVIRSSVIIMTGLLSDKESREQTHEALAKGLFPGLLFDALFDTQPGCSPTIFGERP